MPPRKKGKVQEEQHALPLTEEEDDADAAAPAAAEQGRRSTRKTGRGKVRARMHACAVVHERSCRALAALTELSETDMQLHEEVRSGWICCLNGVCVEGGQCSTAARH